MIRRRRCRQQKKMTNKGRQIDLFQNSQSGFTIIESLVAIVVVTVLLAAIAPALTISVGTRVQAKRVELAAQAARAYIDGVRSGTITPPKHTVSLNEVTSTTTGTTTTKNFNPQRSTFAGTDAPNGTSLSCGASITGYPYCTDTTSSSLYCIDRDGSGCSSSSSQDLVIQAFRSTTLASSGGTSTTTDDVNKGYLLGVRVYRADAFDGTGLKSMADDKVKQNTFAGTGKVAKRKAPLVEITTEVANKTTKFQDYCERFGGCQ